MPKKPPHFTSVSSRTHASSMSCVPQAWTPGPGQDYTITIEVEVQEMVFLNGGRAQQLNAAFSFFVRCDSPEEIDHYGDKLIEGGNPWPVAG
jgi:predicted 3-demethylubiquinone-9 3-methyltransferase (glyoxalase superfamily)